MHDVFSVDASVSLNMRFESLTADGSLHRHVPLKTTDSTAPFAPGWNSLARRPPMGWRSWNAMGGSITQNHIEANVDLLVSTGLAETGYRSAGIDEGWEACGHGVNRTQHDAHGRPVVNVARFPNIGNLVAHARRKNISMGWYLNGCACEEREELDQIYVGDIKSLHKFGFSSVKFDGCGAQNNMTRYAELMKATEKEYDIEDCKAGDCRDGSDNSGCPTHDWCPFTFFRVSRDIDCTDTRWFLNMQSAVRFLAPEPLSRQHCYAYGDMLEVGRLSTYELSRAHCGAWVITIMPLVLDLDLRMTETLSSVMDIFSNKEVLEINQNFAGHPGRLVKQWTPAAGTAPSEEDPAQLYATMLYASCDEHDANQTGWSWDARAMTVKFASTMRELCLDAGPGRRGAPGQKFSTTMEHGDGIRLVANVTDGATQRSMCVDSNDWSGINTFLAECTDLHFGCSQVFTFEKSGLLSSKQSDFAGPLRRCIGALPNGHGNCWARPPPDGDPQSLNEPNVQRAKLLQLWEKPQPDGSLAILLLNMQASGNTTVQLSFATDLHLPGSFVVRDIWAHMDLVGGEAQTNRSVVVPARDSRMFMLRPMKSDDATQRRYGGQLHQRFTVCGHSSGGTIASNHFFAFSDRISGLGQVESGSYASGRAGFANYTFANISAMSLKATGGPWYEDLVTIFQALEIVTNNAPDAVGGSGKPRMAPLAPLCGVAESNLLLKTDDQAEAWVRGKDTVVSISSTVATFKYTVSVQNRTWLSDGQVALQCGGRRYSSSAGSLKLIHALVWDGVDSTWLSSDRRVTDVHEQALWQKGYANAALELKIPMRVDQHLPSDILASVLFGAHVVSRCTGDSPTGVDGSDVGRESVLLSSSAFIASVGVRPHLDVLWSTSSQLGNPYNVERLDVEHDFLVAVLSTGPVGIGDLVNRTNATLLRQCARSDGVILKPSSAAIRIDRFYHAAAGEERFEVTAAPSSLAASAGARLHPAADSRAVLADNSQRELWNWNILSSVVVPVLSVEDVTAPPPDTTCGSMTNNTANSNTVVGMDKSIRTPEACCAACYAFPTCDSSETV